MDLLSLRCVLSVELYGKLTGISALLTSDFRVAFWEKTRRLAHVNNNGVKTVLIVIKCKRLFIQLNYNCFLILFQWNSVIIVYNCIIIVL